MPELLAKVGSAIGLAAVMAKSTLSYYVKGPRCAKWPLWFQLHRDAIHRAIYTKPKGQPTDETIDQIDFDKVAAENRKWDLPASHLPSDIGTYERISIKVSQVQINPVEAFGGTGAAESGLLALSEADRTASGMDREIPAELTVPASLKQPSDATLDVFACRPLADGEKIVLYLHGGAYKFGSAASHRALTGRIANHASVRCVTIDYRLAPLHPYPAQLHDAYTAFWHLVQMGFRAEDIVVAGDSAGGNLALALTVLLRHTGHRTRGLLLLSPWVDLTTERPSIRRNAKYDFLCAPPLESPLNPARTFYAPGRPLSPEMITEMAHPLVSPVYADFAEFPPTLIQAGEKEIIVDEISQLYENIAAHNPGAKRGRYVYECYADMIHVFHQFLDLPDAQYAIAKAGEFIKAL
ncbi:hypothetical protein IWW56_005323 [Coemansia sp. RSA 2131]|nr:hypothetical protein IWW56_005323 [Coemansia sp. RSA 2131]KAJ2655398.1 hypothetical protein IW148_006067 [Coemansia sp. RSA 1199]